MCGKPHPTPHPKDREAGQRVRELRRMRGITQEKLARTLGVTAQQVQKYERGFNRISVGRLHDMAEAIGVSVYELLQMPEFPLEPAVKSHASLIKVYRHLPSGQQLAVLALVKGLLEAEQARI